MNVEELRTKKGFIAALDQSGGSSKKTLINYGYQEKDIINDEVMFDLIHQMRTRIISDSSFSSKYILGTILFKNTMENKINGINTVDYLLKKGIPSFLRASINQEIGSSGWSTTISASNCEKSWKSW